MGCSVIWSYWDLLGRDRITRMVLIDQAPTVNVLNGWTDEQKAEAGALFAAQALYDTAAALAGPDGVKPTEGLVNDLLFTKSYPRDKLGWVLAQNLEFPREYGARLLVDHCTQDWRDTIRTIDIPAVVVGGRASFFTPRSQEWVAQQMPGALVHIFAAEEGGGHFRLMENPAKFNRVLGEFLG